MPYITQFPNEYFAALEYSFQHLLSFKKIKSYGKN
jgi:hypothetical protein